MLTFSIPLVTVDSTEIVLLFVDQMCYFRLFKNLDLSQMASCMDTAETHSV